MVNVLEYHGQVEIEAKMNPRHHRCDLRAMCILVCAMSATTTLAAPVEVRTLQSNGEPADDSLCARCVDGDYLVSNGRLELVIGGSHRRDESFYKFPTADGLGSIISIKPAGTNMTGDIMVGTPYIRIDNTTQHVRYDTIEIVQSEERVTFVAAGLYSDDRGARAQFVAHTAIANNAEWVDLTLTVTNIGAVPIDDLIYSLYFDPHQIYDFSPADAAAHRQFRFRAYPRENHLIAWQDRTVRVEDSDYSHSGWDGGMILPDPVAITLEPGNSDSRRYTLFAGAEHHSVLKNVFRENDVETAPAFFDFTSESSDYFEIIVRDAQSSAVFFRSFEDRPAPLTIELPVGNYIVQANFFPGIAVCVLSVATGQPGRCQLEDPPQGQLAVSIVNKAGENVPGKISFNGLPPTRSPYFRPENPSRDDGYWESHKNSVFPVSAETVVTLPVGSYLVSATRGPEYSMDQKTVEITVDQTKPLVLQIDRVIDRPDLVSIDTHLHTLESDGAVTIDEKIQALVASGVNVAVATDHNFPVDYGIALEQLGLQEELLVVTGAEVTVPERLDYNTYPMAVRPDVYNHGAIDALSTDISSRFQASRKRDPGVVLQVNHPHSWQFDYFEWFGLDPESAAFAYDGFDTGFDLLEVVNGADYETPENQATRKDWFNLLRRGFFFPLVGTSDSHEIDQDEPGFSRTYVYREDEAGSTISIEKLMHRMRQGRSFASNGPILDLSVLEKYRPGDTVTVVNSVVPIVVDVWTAPWIDVTNLRLYINGLPRSIPLQALPHPTALHRQAAIELALEGDTYIVAEVTGDDDLFPMLQRRSGTDGESFGVRPYALTNPIFIDVDGNGKFDSPLPHIIERRQRNTKSESTQ